MKSISGKQQMQVNSGSMADIAFLLLIFFMITTTIQSDQGISLTLPPDHTTSPAKIHERNIFKIQINAEDQLLIEGEQRLHLSGLRKDIQLFIMNNGKLDNLSTTPAEAVVSIKTSRGTTHKMFVKVLDEVKAAYHELYASRVNITPKAFLKLSSNDPREKRVLKKAKEGIPMNISIAEPTN